MFDYIVPVKQNQVKCHGSVFVQEHAIAISLHLETTYSILIVQST